AAGVLGALAIISATLIVLADRDKKNNTPVEQTITDTVTPPPTPQSAPTGWTKGPLTGIPGDQIGNIRLTGTHAVISEARRTDAVSPGAPDPYDEMPR
ncbi:MAG TPA: hypothetical protein PK594_07190, partial [Mycobacterium sp.]|nr:hypothetical protein [Mycobacterium sp.]